jgi:hypothetical protein
MENCLKWLPVLAMGIVGGEGGFLTTTLGFWKEVRIEMIANSFH